MGGSTFSRVKFNAREIMLSADSVREERLFSRDVQEEFAQQGSDSTGGPISALDKPLSLLGIAATFTMTLGANRGFFYDATFPGLDADDSTYLTLRWAQQVLTIAAPDATNPRIDLVVATPTMVDTDSQSRNILVDPVLRTITPQNVNKTSNPVSTITVITGTPGATPAVPALPAHQAAVAEVYVPAAVADATSFQVGPRLWRKMMAPGGLMNGPLVGCDMYCSNPNVDPATTDATYSLFSNLHKCFIDGELVEFVGHNLATSVDATGNPFSGAAPAGSSKPYFVYLCGGRNLPQGGFAFTIFNPAVLVESTVSPDEDGHPNTLITTPRGTTIKGAIHIATLFVFRNTTKRQVCYMANGWVYGKKGLEVFVASAATSLTLASRPANIGASIVRVHMNILVAGAGISAVDVNPSSMVAPAALGDGTDSHTGTPGAGNEMSFTAEVPLSPNDAGLALRLGNVTSIDHTVVGYAHHVRRVRGVW